MAQGRSTKIISMIKGIWTSNLSIKISLSGGEDLLTPGHREIEEALGGLLLEGREGGLVTTLENSIVLKVNVQNLDRSQITHN